jgi:uncharacterized protein
MTGTVASPCISICIMNDETDLCEGCLRTIDEIMVWGEMPDVQKTEVWNEIAKRREALGDPI